MFPETLVASDSASERKKKAGRLVAAVGLLLACILLYYFLPRLFGTSLFTPNIDRKSCTEVRWAFGTDLAFHKMDLARSLVPENEQDKVDQWMHANRAMQCHSGIIESLLDDEVWQGNGSGDSFTVTGACANSYFTLEGKVVTDQDGYCRVVNWSATVENHP